MLKAMQKQDCKNKQTTKANKTNEPCTHTHTLTHKHTQYYMQLQRRHEWIFFSPPFFLSPTPLLPPPRTQKKYACKQKSKDQGDIQEMESESLLSSSSLSPSVPFFPFFFLLPLLMLIIIIFFTIIWVCSPFVNTFWARFAWIEKGTWLLALSQASSAQTLFWTMMALGWTVCAQKPDTKITLSFSSSLPSTCGACHFRSFAILFFVAFAKTNTRQR